MSEVYKCMVCGFTSETPGEHCGQAMGKQTIPDMPTDTGSTAGETAAPKTEAPAESPAAEPKPNQ